MSTKEVNEKQVEIKEEKTVKKEHHEHLARPKKASKWSYERCLKYSKRYHSQEEWKKGSPSSYKAAVSHGWVEQCCSYYKSGDYSSTYHKVA